MSRVSSWTPTFVGVTSRKRKAGVPPAFSLTQLGEPIQIMPVERHAVKDFLLALGTTHLPCDWKALSFYSYKIS
jgi:hypothetical protein